MLVATVLLGRTAMPCPRSMLLLIVALAYPLHAGVLSLLASHFGPLAASVPAALAAALTLLLGLSAFADNARGQDFSVAAPLAIAYLLILRLIYLGQLELAPQEAYYWNYAQHLDIGYLDHPPLVAWLIAMSLALGQGEFFVRLPAVLAWAVMLAFVAAFAHDLAGRGNALRSALLAATLPFFFGIGVLMTPDAPLAAAWAAALFWLHRALLGGRQTAWLGAGVAIGIGMLSKYSMVLVPAATLAFMIVDAPSRRLLLSPWAWGGALIALLVFAPVIVWNIQHDWASFAFQGARRLGERTPQFSLHVFLGSVVLLLTPLGVLALWRLPRPPGGMTSPCLQAVPAADAAALARRRRLFVLVFTLVPLLVLDACVELASMPEAKLYRHSMPISTFFTGPGKTRKSLCELVTGVRIPVPAAGHVSRFYKHGTRPALDISTISIGVAGNLKDGVLSNVRVAFGAVAPTPLRATATESALEGRHLDAATIEAAAVAARDEVNPIDDVRATAWYRKEMIHNITKRILGNVAQA